VSEPSSKWNYLFALVSLVCLGCFVYLYLEGQEDQPLKQDQTVEVVDFSKTGKERRRYQQQETQDSISSPSHSIYAGRPLVEDYPNRIKVLENSGFVVGYDEKRKNPAWVAYKVRACSGRCFRGLKRPSHFEIDHRTRSRVQHSDYSRSGYDRGHMAPNHAIATRYGRKAQEQTFLMTNIVPQRKGLNRGVWRELEQEIAGSVSRRAGEVWVITGPLYDDSVSDRFLRNGSEIPDGFYKIVLDELPGGELAAKAYVIPQDVNGDVNPSRFLVSVDEVEAKAGLDFFSELDDVLEEQLEGRKAFVLGLDW
jgi:endonuclease G